VQWFGVLAPTGTPRPIILKVQGEMARILKLPDVHERMRVQGADPVGNRPEQFDALVKSEIAKWADIARQAGIRAE
jgi:tripartite-type tricarboxylate transporter receptor subunit TctC